MSNREKLEIAKSREYLVVKANDLIQKNRFELSLPEQKTIAYICSLIKPCNNGEYQIDYEFNIREYCKICGFDYDNGNNYATIKGILKRLRDNSMWVRIEGGSETLMAWLDRVIADKGSGIVKIRIDDRLAPYLFNLGQNFTKYELYNILAMKSSFSIRMYELLKSYSFRKEIAFDIDELKKILMVENVKSYDRFPDFRRFVLEISQKEINEYTDINISFETVTKGRKVIKIIFHIEEKKIMDKIIANNTTVDMLDCKPIKSKRRKMTKEEKAEYNKLTANATQMEMDFS